MPHFTKPKKSKTYGKHLLNIRITIKTFSQIE